MGFKFEKPQKARKEAKAAEEAQLTDHQKSYRDREKREEKRFQMAVDSGFWICFCFHDAEERGRSSRLRLSPTTTTFGAAPTTSCACSATPTTSKASSGSMPWRSTATCTWTGRRSLRPLGPKANLTRIGKSRRLRDAFLFPKTRGGRHVRSYSPRSGKHRQPSALRVQSRSRQLFRPLLLLRGNPGPARS